MARKLQEPNRLFHKVAPKSEGQKALWESLYDPEIQYTAVSGQAGVGKTYLSCYFALDQVMKEKYKKIYVARSVLPIKSEAIGFIPGGISDKLEGYLVPMMENFDKFIPDTGFLNKIIEAIPLVQIRGRSLEKSVIILDEAQNLSMDVLRAVITRIDHRSKLIICGDFKQNDTHKPITDFERFCRALDGMNAFEWVQLHDEDQQRNGNITEINKRLDKLEQEN